MKVLCIKWGNVSGLAVAPCVKCKHVWRNAKINGGCGKGWLPGDFFQDAVCPGSTVLPVMVFNLWVVKRLNKTKAVKAKKPV